jgi:SAM-dependent methyltransferase
MEENGHTHFQPDEMLILPKQSIHIHDFYRGDGWILDIGGGGEGIIGMVKGRQVVSIDLSKRELEETSNQALKVVMDATDLRFLDSSFDVVTAFFSFMYMKEEMLERALLEIFRVLKAGGELLIWDPVVALSDSPEHKIFVSRLDIELPDGRVIEAGYGHSLRQLGPERIVRRAESLGLEILERKIEGPTFFLRVRKS